MYFFSFYSSLFPFSPFPFAFHRLFEYNFIKGRERNRGKEREGNGGKRNLLFGFRYNLIKGTEMEGLLIFSLFSSKFLQSKRVGSLGILKILRRKRIPSFTSISFTILDSSKNFGLTPFHFPMKTLNS